MHVRSDSVNVLNIPSTSTVWSPPRSSISGKGLDKYYRAIIVEDSAYQVVHCTDLEQAERWLGIWVQCVTQCGER